MQHTQYTHKQFISSSFTHLVAILSCCCCR